MRQNYLIEVISQKKCLIIGLNYKRMSLFYPDIEQYLTKINFDGLVIFDLVFSNGIGQERLYTTEFHLNKFQFDTSKKLTNRKEYFTMKSNSIIVKSKIKLENTILTASQRANYPDSLLNAPIW